MKATIVSGLIALLLVAGLPSKSQAETLPNWSEGAPVLAGGNSNPYQLVEPEFNSSVQQGRLHAAIYPVEITGMLPPLGPYERVLDGQPNEDNPLTRLSHWLLDGVIGLHSVDQVFNWVGLHPYPSEDETGIYSIPYPNGKRPGYRVGFTKIETQDGVGFTLSCGTCHSSNLFGKTVLGMTNRFPRANETFLLSKKGIPLVGSALLRTFAGATDGEIRMFERTKERLRFVGVKKPQTLGIDTSLAQVALSLAHRAQDGYATLDPEIARNPRPEKLSSFVADSKPAVWWNVKYKNRWLSDGSVISGNPIYTNLLWNEIGRGADLHELEQWLNTNSAVVRDLTSAVFSSEAPRFTDFFPANRIDLAAAKRGETIYEQRCAHCHGGYDKVWDQPGAESLPLVEQLKTWRVRYHEKTPVVDVGTDPNRWQGMVSLEQGLNPLEISQKNGIVIRTQKGYVPPPLVGIWARWPYFHNNSAPSLCAVLTRQDNRPETYDAVDANDPERDFDGDCNGYPLNPANEVRATYDTSRDGMHNTGHDEGIFLKNGQELLGDQDKRDLIRFLQTL